MRYILLQYTPIHIFIVTILIQFWQLHTEVQWFWHTLMFTLCTLTSGCCAQSKHYKLMVIHSLHHLQVLAKLFTIFTLCSRLFCVWQTYDGLQESAVPWYKISFSHYRFCIFNHRFYIACVVILSLHYTGKSKFYSQLNIPHLSEVIPKIVNKFLVLGNHY